MGVSKDHDAALIDYRTRFESLHRGITPAGPAPHKLVMLLAVMREFGYGRITENRIVPSDQLLESFRLIWDEEVHTDHKSNFALPFFHLRGEGFWHLIAASGQARLLHAQTCISSLGVLRRMIEYVKLDDELFRLLQENSARRILCKILLGQLK